LLTHGRNVAFRCEKRVSKYAVVPICKIRTARNVQQEVGMKVTVFEFGAVNILFLTCDSVLGHML